MLFPTTNIHTVSGFFDSYVTRNKNHWQKRKHGFQLDLRANPSVDSGLASMQVAPTGNDGWILKAFERRFFSWS